jgi:Ulp1 family protease
MAVLRVATWLCGLHGVFSFLWRHLESWQKECVYIYSSHFFTQLSGSGALTPDERFARVSRWTLKESDLFEKRFLFIPINDRYVGFSE